MNVYITRTWANNRNHFIISDCKEQHDAKLTELRNSGVMVLETNAYEHGMGEVVVLSDKKADDNGVSSLGETIGIIFSLVTIQNEIVAAASSLVSDGLAVREQVAMRLIKTAQMISDELVSDHYTDLIEKEKSTH